MDDIERITEESEKQLRTERFSALMKEPLEKKISRSESKVDEFVNILTLPEVYVSTSGGKDSAVLSDLCKKLYPDIQHVMFDTGLEYMETVNLAREQGAIVIPPKTSWKKFCDTKGYPAVSKQVSKRVHDAKISCLGACITCFSKVYHLSDKWLHLLECDIPISQKCCDKFKKEPSHKFAKSPIIGTRAEESAMRKNAWKRSGCNTYSSNYKKGVSRPISLWTEKDVNQYVLDNDVRLSELYTQYEQKRTGCVCCPYGAQLDGSRFDLLKRLEPKRYEYFMSTPLRQILMLTGVKIVSDPDYMMDMEAVQEKISEWHEAVKGNDKYLTYKVKWLKSRYPKDEIVSSVQHLAEKGKLLYPESEIMKCLKS